MRLVLMQLFILLLGFTACSEAYRSMDPTPFNQEIAERTDLSDPKALMEAYYKWPENEREGGQTVSIVWEEHDGKVEITLIHEGLQDDSQAGNKVVMLAERKGKSWNVLEIRKNWKCWPGRGHTGWGTQPCS